MIVGKTSKKKKGTTNEVLGNQDRHQKELKPSQESPSTSSLQKTFIPILILLLVSFAVYFNALSGEFVYDDNYQIVDNPWIKDITNIPTIFSESVWSFQSKTSISNYYRPLMFIVYMLNYHIFGLKPWGFHLVNILFHCGASVLVFLVIRKFLADRRVTASSVYLSPPFIAALLFVSHPIHTEVVTWIAGLPDVGFTFFYLLSFYLYMSFRDGAKGGYLLSILSFAVATLFKEPTLTLPIMLIAYDSQVNKLDESISASIKRYTPYVVVSVGYLVVRYYVLSGFSPMESYPDLSTYESIINIFPLFSEYLTSLFWPFNLNLWHTFHPISSPFEAKGMASIGVTVIFCIVAVTAYRKNKAFFFGLFLFVIPLLPVFYIKGISGKPYAERYLYLPSVGYVLLLAIFLAWSREKLPRLAKSITIVFIIMAGLYTSGTINRNIVWQNSLNLWSDTVKKSPDSALAHIYLGFAYATQGQFERAIPEYQAALMLKPDDVEASVAHNNLGNAYQSRGQLQRAILEYQMALELMFDYAEAHYNLGIAYAAQGQLDRAIPEYQGALMLKPDYAEAHYNLGIAYESQGQLDKAISEYQTILRLKPDFDEARQRLNDIVSKQH